MSRRVGQVKKREGGGYLVRVFAGRDAGGKRHYVSQVVQGTKRDAERVLAEMTTRRDRGDAVMAPRKTVTFDVTVETFAMEWLAALRDNQRLRERSIFGYAQVVSRYLVPYLGAIPLALLTEEAVADMMRQMAKRGLSGRTVRQAREVLRNMLQAAMSRRLVATNVARGALVREALPPKSRVRKPTLPIERLDDFLAAARTEELYPVFLLMLYTGLRPSEALALRWADFRNGAVSVTRVLVDNLGAGADVFFAPPKTARSIRSVHVPQEVFDEIVATRGARPDDALAFAHADGSPLRQDHVRNVFARILKKAKLPHVRLYDLRHTHATWLLERGVDIAAVSDRLGHTSIQLTIDTYAQVTERLRASVVDALRRRG